ncbi:MAG: hypothetical protein IPK26_08545 [Planctomycetes bacterium]|nr:hypothetical protein [Planctomycetota bacterium]
MSESTPPTPASTSEPLSAQELGATCRNPQHLLNLVFGERGRLAATVGHGRGLGTLALVLLFGSSLLVLPFGLALAGSGGWRLPALYTGSVLLCWPSLHIVSVYLGCRCQPTQTLVLALLVALVASLFTLGFAPILWFLDQTMRNADSIDAHVIGIVLAAIGLLAGLGELLRMMLKSPLPSTNDVTQVAWLLWAALLVTITWRMARVIGLLP